jgi:hypothetical protein
VRASPTQGLQLWVSTEVLSCCQLDLEQLRLAARLQVELALPAARIWEGHPLVNPVHAPSAQLLKLPDSDGYH